MTPVRRRLVLCAPTLLGATLLQGSGCGYILYPERRGRSGGRIDVGVAVMDGLWLLVFLIPGIIAFVVDFSTGCIYLGGRGARGDGSLAVLRVGENLDRARIESAVGAHLGRRIDLRDPRVVTRRLASRDEIRPALAGSRPPGSGDVRP
jgi:hypothetical protein